MWSRRDAAQILLAAIIFLIVGLLLFPPAARPATGHDAELVSWYLKGEGDAVFGSRGWTIGKLACTAHPRFVSCLLRLDSRAGSSLCSHGRFNIAHFGVAGQMTTPATCKGGPPA
jgi:hypothetical protein